MNKPQIAPEYLHEVVKNHQAWLDLWDSKDAFVETSDDLRARLVSSYLPDVDLSTVNLTSMIAWHANFSGSKFVKSILKHADLRHSSLVAVNFRSADLSDADLSFSNLQNANLIGANLDWCSFRGADLRGAKLDQGISDCWSFAGANTGMR